MELKRVREWVVPDMSCEGCVPEFFSLVWRNRQVAETWRKKFCQPIRRSLSDLAGVVQVTVELGTKRVQVLFDPAQVQEEAIQSRIEQAGFSPQPAPLTQGE